MMENLIKWPFVLFLKSLTLTHRIIQWPVVLWRRLRNRGRFIFKEPLYLSAEMDGVGREFVDSMIGLRGYLRRIRSNERIKIVFGGVYEQEGNC